MALCALALALSPAKSSEYVAVAACGLVTEISDAASAAGMDTGFAAVALAGASLAELKKSLAYCTLPRGFAGPDDAREDLPLPSDRTDRRGDCDLERECDGDRDLLPLRLRPVKRDADCLPGLGERELLPTEGGDCTVARVSATAPFDFAG